MFWKLIHGNGDRTERGRGMYAADRIHRGEESWVFQEDLRSPQGMEEEREDRTLETGGLLQGWG